MSAETRTIEIPNSEKLEFTFKMDKEAVEGKKVELNVDLSKLTAADILEWAYSAIIVSYQSKLRSKNPPKLEEGQTAYKWAVPSRGTRSVVDPAKVAEQAEKLVDKMDNKTKYELMIRMGVEPDAASSITGYIPPTK